MYVWRLMLPTVKEEGVTIKSEYFWHNPILLFVLFGANIGIIFDTSKFCINFLFINPIIFLFFLFALFSRVNGGMGVMTSTSS